MISKKTTIIILFTAFLTMALNQKRDGPEQGVAEVRDLLVSIMNEKYSTLEEKTLKARHVIANVFSFKDIARNVLGKHWDNLSDEWKDRFLVGFEERIGDEALNVLFSLIEENDRVPEVSVLSSKIIEKDATLQVGFENQGKPLVVTVNLIKKQDTWLIYNLSTAQSGLTRFLKGKVRNILDQGYSREVALSRLKDLPYLLIDDFSLSEIGALPPGWGWREKDNDKIKQKPPYKVMEESGNRYLNAVDEGQSVILIKEFKWNIRKYPCLSWRWRVHSIPAGGDERYDETNDSAAGVYIIYYQNFLGIPKVVKYAWSSSLDVCETTQRDKMINRPFVIVAQSGKARLGEWITEEFNAYENYIEAFGEEPPDQTVAVCILSDANKTNSVSVADYDDLIVKKICKQKCK